MAKPDKAHEWTDQELATLEKRIASVYKQAADEMQDKVDAYFESFAKCDAEQKALIGTIVNGKPYTEQDYKQWRLAQIGRGERMEKLRDQLAERMTKANEAAAAYINDATPGVYSLNRNYAAYSIEQVTGDVGFTVWDEQTVKRLIKERPDLMPYYPPERAVKRGIDLAWGKRQITAQVTSGILQGESIKHLADRLQTNIPTMNRDSAIRTARTAITGAQNAGRMDSYRAAEEMGIKLRKQWMATLDGRTRHAHAMLDGQTAKTDEPFHSELGDIMFPGDPNAAPANVYNCRCTLLADVDGVDISDAQRRARDPETGESALVEDMTYEEWVGWKRGGMNAGDTSSSLGIPEQIGQVDFRNKNAVLQWLNKIEKECVGLLYEVNCTVTADGKVWRVVGQSATVNPEAIPSSLRGSYSYHNHPAGETYYSFSAADVAFFIQHGEAYTKASDELFEYMIRRTAETVEKSYDEVYHRFREIENTDVFAMKWLGSIDPDMDSYHEVMKILSRELKFEYERKKKSG